MTSDDELMFESLNKEESYVGRMILNARSWLVLQLQRVIVTYIYLSFSFNNFVFFSFDSQFSNGYFTDYYLLVFLSILELL